jgi:citrate synthase
MALRLSSELREPKWVEMSERIAALIRKKEGLDLNVDVYSATVYYLFGILADLPMCLQYRGRRAGRGMFWKQLADNRLHRPLSQYSGETVGKKFVPIDQR